MKKLAIGLIIGWLTALLVAGLVYLMKPDTWTAFIQVDPSQQPLASYTLGTFTDQQSCEAAGAWLKSLDAAAAARFRCGRNCEQQPRLGTLICESFVEKAKS